ncbi:hypothetical protein Lepto7376_0923 [[Leptolyngbya] sp. PCC 7376]|nr:hypothetical protein Lepto7376_0923 [[Leptolyngbya] sp. PCC 7376]
MHYPEPVPKGLSVKPLGQYRMVIDYERTGMDEMNIFLMVWLSLWTVGCLGLLVAYIEGLQGTSVNTSEPIPLVMVIFFWAADLVAAIVLINALFSKQSFHLDYADLTIHTKLWRWHRTRKIPKSNIQSVVQIKDGDRGKDSFPSWGLQLKGKSSITLIFRQPYEKSEWLGQMIADWAKLPFTPIPRKAKRFGR